MVKGMPAVKLSIFWKTQADFNQKTSVILHLYDDLFSNFGGFMNCPQCNSDRTVKNGLRYNGKQNFKCHNCGRQFVEEPSPHYHVSDEKKTLVDRLLLKKLPLAGIARVVNVSERWLQYYVNRKYEEVPQIISVTSKKKGV